MRDKILAIINDFPKHYSIRISSDSELSAWVIDRSSDECSSFAERIYQALHGQDTARCPNGKKKTWANMSTGYRFCGRAAHCSCAKKAVSDQLSKHHAKLGTTSKSLISQKRSQTNLRKYGYVNAGQSEKAKENRNEFYEDRKQVAAVVEKIANTKLAAHGNPKYNNTSQIKSTWQSKVSQGYFHSVYPNKKLDILEDVATMRNLFSQHSVEEISAMTNVHIQTVYRYLNAHQIRSPYSSVAEQEIVNYLVELGVTNIVRRTRKLIRSGKEIDIYLPDYSLAIEYNGIYWHHDKVPHIDKRYHWLKYQECRDQNIQLLSIFSDHWQTRKSQVQQLIRHKLGLSDRRCAARSCTVQSISVDQARTFLDRMHIQGYVGASVRLGLIHNDSLVAVMLFGKNRSGAGIGSDSSGTELLRFAVDGVVPGAAGKLLAYYVRNYHPSKIVSFSDNEWSHGNLYQSLGFSLESEIKPSYWYITPKDGLRLHRYNFAKHKLIKAGYDQSMTEREIVEDLGLMRVWDCGKKKWVLNIKS